MMKQIKLILPLLLVPVVIGTIMLLGLPESATEAKSTIPNDAAQVAQDGDEPVVVTVEVTVEVTREVTVIVTPTFTPLPPTPTPLPPELTVDDDAFLGSADATVKIVEFSDYRCGFCRRFYLTTLYQITDHYGDLVQFVYRDFPIFGEESINGAIGAECAGDQGKFWDFHNALFDNENQEEPQPLTQEVLAGFASNLDLNMDDWNACFVSDDTMTEIVFDAQTAQDWGVTGTPTFFINGKKLVGAQPIEVFYQFIDAELAAQGIEPPPLPTAEAS